MSKYFKASQCNKDWQSLESSQSKRLRGYGWWRFRKAILAERGCKCEECGIELPSPKLHLHHIFKIRTHRHLRFEPSNIKVCCQACHNKLECGADLGPAPQVMSEDTFVQKRASIRAKMKGKKLTPFYEICSSILEVEV